MFLPSQGERCSFALQMWFYFLCGLRSDLWSVLPPELAKDVLGYVLAETLQLLVRRYSRVRASYKRHLQIRYFEKIYKQRYNKINTPTSALHYKVCWVLMDKPLGSRICGVEFNQMYEICVILSHTFSIMYFSLHLSLKKQIRLTIVIYCR